MKKVFVIGAHGHVGHYLVPKLVKQGYQVIAGVRKEAEFNSLPKSNLIKPVLFDLNRSVKAMEATFKSTRPNAIIFSAGAGGGVPAKLTIQIDLDGAAKSILAAEKAGIKRYEMVSAVGSDNRKVWSSSSLYVYYAAKHYADLYLRSSNLDYTILHPVALSNDSETGKIQLHPQDLTQVSISRADVANVLVEVLDNSKTIYHEYTIANGATPIKDIFG